MDLVYPQPGGSSLVLGGFRFSVFGVVALFFSVASRDFFIYS